MGAALVGAPGLAKVSFTGSVPTGRAISMTVREGAHT